MSQQIKQLFNKQAILHQTRKILKTKTQYLKLAGANQKSIKDKQLDLKMQNKEPQTIQFQNSLLSKDQKMKQS